MSSNQRPEGRPPPERLPTQVGCGCSLPTSGAALVILTVVLALLIAKRTEGFSPLWLVLIPLVLGIMILFGRVAVTRGKR